MTKSIRFKMTMILIAIIGAMILVSSICNFFFAEKYYRYSERSALISTYDHINDIVTQENRSDEEIQDMIADYINQTQIKITVAKPDEKGTAFSFYQSNLLYDARMDEKVLNHLLIVRDHLQSYWERMDEGDETVKEELDQMRKSDDPDQAFLADLIENHYCITYDNVEHPTGMYLLGMAGDEYFVELRVAMAGIRESARISSRLFLYVGLVGILLGTAAILAFSASFTKPIKQMARTADQMAALHFDEKIDIDRDDELGELGRSMNLMSEKLESTIADLKAANLELTTDIQKKEEIDQMRKDFLSHVSHELKTPIALIQGYAEGLAENVNDDEESRSFYCDVIVDEARKMNTMVVKLLNLNEIEFGGQKPDVRRFDICQMIRNKLAASSILLEKKDLKAEIEDERPVFVWADELMIEEAFSNYLSNAINHAVEGSVIRIRFEQRDDGIRLHVCNRGEKIPEEELDKIWIRFYKTDKARTRAYGGSGIGLSLVAATMEAHGKAYGVTNTDDGVDFYLDLDADR